LILLARGGHATRVLDFLDQKPPNFSTASRGMPSNPMEKHAFGGGRGAFMSTAPD
jgi:hypothetical protein